MRAIWALIALFIILTRPSWAQDDVQAREDLEAVNSAISEIESWLNEANSRHSSAQETLREAELAISTLQTDIADIQQQISNSNLELAALREQQAELQASKNEQAEVLADVLRAAYKSGEHNSLRLLLNGDEPSKAARMLHYAAEISRYQLERIETFRLTLDNLKQVESELDMNLSRLRQQEAELAEQSQQLALARDERAAALAALNADINSRNQELEQLQFDQAELQALLEEIARAMEGIRSFADVPPIGERQGRLTRPVDGAITASFGSSYGGGSLRRQGIIIAVSPGSPVQAVHPGQVVFADWLRGAGLLIIVDHGDGYMSLYGGNEALAKNAGDWVDAGEVLAISGLGGENSTPGLYFEIRRHGSALDPENWLASGS